MRRDEVSERALEFLKKYGIDDYPTPVEDIAIELGIQVVRGAAEWSESGFLLRDGENVVIGVNSRNSPKRQRFTIAHELGHWLLHEGKPLIVDQSIMVNKRNDVSSQATDKQEIEANQFAAVILMPKRHVASAIRQCAKRTFNSRDEFIAAMAKEFDVSAEAMSWRLINLGVLSN